MASFRISSHGRLQDWIAVEHGYFEEEGLDYEFDVRALENAAQDVAGDGQSDIRVGAYELYLSGGGGKGACGVMRIRCFQAASTRRPTRRSAAPSSWRASTSRLAITLAVISRRFRRSSRSYHRRT